MSSSDALHLSKTILSFSFKSMDTMTIFIRIFLSNPLICLQIFFVRVDVSRTYVAIGWINIFYSWSYVFLLIKWLLSISLSGKYDLLQAKNLPTSCTLSADLLTVEPKYLRICEGSLRLVIVKYKDVGMIVSSYFYHHCLHPLLCHLKCKLIQKLILP